MFEVSKKQQQQQQQQQHTLTLEQCVKYIQSYQ